MYFFAAANIAAASANEAAIGLSINIGLRAFNTGKACSRCKRPSFVSRKTTSTFFKRSAIEPTISTPSLFTSSIYPGIRSTLLFISLLPFG
ncbi:hypothetical protein D3C86_2027860 [compost metagenome]